jgi:hypothetical protein
MCEGVGFFFGQALLLRHRAKATPAETFLCSIIFLS